MITLEQEYKCGISFFDCCKNAKIIAEGYSVIVRFDFNGIECLVSKDTDLELLYRDYDNAFMMEWKSVGPNCAKEYSDKIKLELNTREQKAKAAAEMAQLERKRKDEHMRKFFEALTEGVEVEIVDKENYLIGKSKNQDSYGACIYEYAEGWAKLMQVRISLGEKVHQMAETSSEEMGFLGITGFMYGAAVGILSQYWKHGEELRKWHNKEYGHDGEGFVNPAILSIKTNK